MHIMPTLLNAYYVFLKGKKIRQATCLVGERGHGVTQISGQNEASMLHSITPLVIDETVNPTSKADES